MRFFRDMAVVVPGVWAISFAVNGPVSDTLRAVIIAFVICTCYFIGHYLGYREGLAASRKMMVKHMRSISEALFQRPKWEYESGITDIDKEGKDG